MFIYNTKTGLDYFIYHVNKRSFSSLDDQFFAFYSLSQSSKLTILPSLRCLYIGFYNSQYIGKLLACISDKNVKYNTIHRL